MKIRANIRSIPFLLTAGLVSACSAAAADFDPDSDFHAGPEPGSFYLSGDAGVAIMQPIITGGSVDGMNAGPRLDVSAGYNVTENFAVELEAGFAQNSMSSQDGFQFPSGWTVDFRTVPVAANGIYTLEFNNGWQVYGGLGGGVVITTVDDNFFGEKRSSTDFEFGYQAQAGVKYVFNDHLECGLGYKFLGTLDHHFTLFAGSFSTSPTYMHSILFNVTYRF